MNVWKACSVCNSWKSGNLTSYRIKLVEKIGNEWVEWLEAQNMPYTWEIDDLKEVAEYYRGLLKYIK